MTIDRVMHSMTYKSAQRELNSRLLHGKQMGYHYTMGAKCITTKLSKIGPGFRSQSSDFSSF